VCQQLIKQSCMGNLIKGLLNFSSNSRLKCSSYSLQGRLHQPYITVLEFDALSRQNSSDICPTTLGAGIRQCLTVPTLTALKSFTSKTGM